jgi:hypothetical protein
MEGQADLYNAYNFGEPWNGPNNSKLASRMPAYYTCPNGDDDGGRFQANAWISNSVRTSYLAIAGVGTTFPGTRPTSIRDVRDSAATTIMVAEVADTDVHWMEPRDLDTSAMSLIINDRTRPSISSHDPEGPHVICVDGSRPALRPTLPPQVVKALTTIAGGEKIDIRDVQPP